jgi:hypothetical protein
VTDLGHGDNGPNVFFNSTGFEVMYELAMIIDDHGL